MDYLASEVGRKPSPKKEDKKKGKPLFGEKSKLTVSEAEAKARIKAEKKRIRELEREQERQNKKRLAAYKKSVKAQKKALEFGRQTPLAKVVRKRIRKLF
jgi:PBP1b-binding outer membrane lipoprotein LpoB